jgi:Uma2 family endonuclease
MSAVISPPQHYSPEEYLALERNAPFKSEYHEGQIFAMTGASRAHNLVAVNIGRELSVQLKSRPCEAYLNDMRVRSATDRNYFYPDVSVVCGQPTFEDAQTDTLLNPTVVIEVLSPSTEAYDRGAKFGHYRRIASLKEYWLIAQDKPLMERFVRQGDAWMLTVFEGLDAVAVLDSIDCSLALSEVYDKVTFAPDSEQADA